MFQYALGRALSKKLNVPLKLDLSFLLDRPPNADYVFRDYDLHIFNLDVQFATEEEKHRYISPHQKQTQLVFWRLRKRLAGYTYYKEKDFSYDENVWNLTDNTYLDGYWQSPKYFEGIKDLLLEDFSFAEKLPDDLVSAAAEIQNSNSVCLHVRRGDYVSLPQVNQHFVVTGNEYFSNAVSKISAIEKDIKIYVFSDDIEWCVGNFRFDFPAVFVEHEYPGKKLSDYFHLMRLCRHYIISNSSFTWWAAWLNQNADKIVITPKNWFNDPNVSTSDLIPDSWIKI